MNQRKVLDISRRQKAVHARHPNTNIIADPKSSQPPVFTPLENHIQRGDAESRKMSAGSPDLHQEPFAPKLKFTSNDKSSEFRCSPRLKSFPAEELRRFDASPRGETTLTLCQMNEDDPSTKNKNMVHQEIPRFQSIDQCRYPVFDGVPLGRSPKEQLHRPCAPRPENHGKRMISEYQSEGNFMVKKEPEQLESRQVSGRTVVDRGPLRNLQDAAIPEDKVVEKAQHQECQRLNFVPFANDFQEMHAQNYPQKFLQYPQQFPGLGMTSPQDVSINQGRGQQVHQRQQSFNHPQHGEYPWVSSSISASNLHPANRQLDQCFWVQSGPETINYPPVTHAHSHNRQQIIQKPEHPEYPRQRRLEDKPSSNVLRFTLEMICDQEKLVRILRQQGFPEQIVKRQFDGLLAEQQRQLIFLHQLKNFKASSDASKNTQSSKTTRLVKVGENQKPEWMMHITPPWESYGARQEERKNNDTQQRQTGQQNLHGQQNIQQQAQSSPYQQWQEQQTINPNIGCSGRHYDYDQYDEQIQHHPNHYQYHQIAQQNMTEAFPQDQQTFQPQNNQELISQDQIARVESSSLLKLKAYKEVIKRQNQNNGLQNAATVGEALTNLTKRRGLEYLTEAEMNEKHIKLNGTQDSEESPPQNWPHQAPDYVIRQLGGEMRANGLENKRNPDNPPREIKIQDITMNEPMPVYPRRVEQRCYMMQPALADNGIIQTCAPTFDSIGDPSSEHNDNAQVHVYTQGEEGASENHRDPNVGRLSARRVDMYTQQKQEYDQEVLKSCLKGGKGQGQCGIKEHFEESRVIGGVKYIGRKSEFNPNSCSSEQYYESA